MVLSISSADPDSSLPEDAKYSKRWKETKHLYTGEPTYWLSDRNKLPDVVDFFVTKGIPQNFALEK
jgi:hypothetical protein